MMIQSKKYSSGISSHQSTDIVAKMQQIHLCKADKVKPKVQHSFQNNSKMKVESVEITSRIKVQMASTNFEQSVKIRNVKTERIQHSNSSGHNSRNVGYQLMLPPKEPSKGQGQIIARPVKKSSNHHSGSCHTTRTSTKSSTRKEHIRTETRKQYYSKP
ncbi:hypothetical protein I3842_10G103200 [Carya illinoinensis]|uniref:Uncharacterized protein n=1 Tax=Carya illinoinensis TaxID=32201 RepID=A0A922J3K1_CARIL|nr:hypothetical protein I3842_10G103200 [Carya illinoinensis]KAG6692213.1 hypothetical protein I3842_10G103200 [Carya illinoinensis]